MNESADLPTKIVVAPKIAPGTIVPFVQQLRVTLRGKTVGLARWHAPGGEDGVVQILDITIHPDHQRRGIGSMLIREIYRQAIQLFNQRQIKPRRIWASVEQKRQVVARAFFTRHGFHHVAAAKNIYAKQEALIYLRSFD